MPNQNLNPKVSVIIPAYNAENTIEQTLWSVFNQTYAHIEIIVVNDGSTDSTEKLLNKFSERIKIISIANKGVSNARNIGFKHSTGEFIQFLDSDDLLKPNKINLQLADLIKEGGDVAYGNWERFVETNGQITITETIAKTLHNHIETEIFTDFWCPPAVLLYSRSLVEKIGPWKEWLPIIQDARYMLDAAIHKGKFVYTKALVAQYRTGQTTSLSSQNALAFVKDCYNNAKDVWHIWKDDQTDFDLKKNAVLKTLRYCINEFSIMDKVLFNESVNFLLSIESNYIPDQKGSLRLLSSIFGYKQAEQIAAIKRRLWR